MGKVLFTAFLAFCQICAAEQLHAKLYPKGSDRTKLLFTVNSEVSENEIIAEGKDPEGNPAIREKAILQEGKIQRFEIEQLQINAKGLVEVKDKKVYFTKVQDGKTSTDSESLSPNLVVSLTFSSFIKQHWAEISSGKSVDMRFAVWDRKETVGFSLKKIGEEKIDDNDTIKIQMKPTSFVIAALVDPLVISFTKDGQHLVKVSGRAAMKQKVGDKWVDLDADMYYDLKNSL